MLWLRVLSKQTSSLEGTTSGRCDTLTACSPDLSKKRRDVSQYDRRGVPVAFCSLGLASLWLCGRLGTLARHRGSGLRVTLVLAPLVDHTLDRYLTSRCPGGFDIGHVSGHVLLPAVLQRSQLGPGRCAVRDGRPACHRGEPRAQRPRRVHAVAQEGRQVDLGASSNTDR
ncbi:unnamed protein product [Leptidea sinapis]|uniref:Uncharacterized protein n=1 Tax=Leptidea sinapis TaxID=189913 RepID=A0A5E4QIN6_9NEOP|nr:unnamed protein product [Leptidea sinapis]